MLKRREAEREKRSLSTPQAVLAPGASFGSGTVCEKSGQLLRSEVVEIIHLSVLSCSIMSSVQREKKISTVF